MGDKQLRRSLRTRNSINRLTMVLDRPADSTSSSDPIVVVTPPNISPDSPAPGNINGTNDATYGPNNSTDANAEATGTTETKTAETETTGTTNLMEKTSYVTSKPASETTADYGATSTSSAIMTPVAKPTSLIKTLSDKKESTNVTLRHESERPLSSSRRELADQYDRIANSMLIEQTSPKVATLVASHETHQPMPVHVRRTPTLPPLRRAHRGNADVNEKIGNACVKTCKPIDEEQGNGDECNEMDPMIEIYEMDGNGAHNCALKDRNAISRFIWCIISWLHDVGHVVTASSCCVRNSLAERRRKRTVARDEEIAAARQTLV